MEFVGLAALAALIIQFTNMLRFVRGSDWNGVVTLGCAWLAGIGAVLLFSASQMGDTWSINEIPLDAMTFWTKVLVGLLISSSGSTVWDTLRAIDRTGTTTRPKLLPE